MIFNEFISYGVNFDGEGKEVKKKISPKTHGRKGGQKRPKRLTESFLWTSSEEIEVVRSRLPIDGTENGC